MKIKLRPNSNFNDKENIVVLVSLDGEKWEAISIYAFLEIERGLMASEDIGYPNGKGRHFLLDAMIDVAYGQIPKDVVRKYGSRQKACDEVEFENVTEPNLIGKAEKVAVQKPLREFTNRKMEEQLS